MVFKKKSNDINVSFDVYIIMTFDSFQYFTFLLLLNRPACSAQILDSLTVFHDIMLGTWLIWFFFYYQPTPTYQMGIAEGINQAKKDFRKQCDDKCELIRFDTDDMESVKSAMRLLLLPQWTMTVHGEEYVMRAAESADVTNAWSEDWKSSMTNYGEHGKCPVIWVMPTPDSHALDETLQKIVLQHLPHLTKKSLTYLQGRAQINRCMEVESMVNAHFRK